MRTAVTEDPIAQLSFFSQTALHAAYDNRPQHKASHQVGAGMNRNAGGANLFYLADQRPNNRYE